ncbi:MAG: carotenoid oxygenase family protein [Myxococcales bacterium]|nr:carotenoid oxygenase family protein [Myxococcales bacterium]
MDARPSQAQTPSRPGAVDVSGLQASVRRFHGWEPLRVEGEIPAGLVGTLVRTGPGLLERFGRRLAHAFEADGALQAVRLAGDGTASGAVRLVESPGYREEQAAGRPLYGSATSRWRRISNGLAGRTKTTGNTNVMQWQGGLLALMEGGRPVEIDPRSLDTGEVSDLGGVLGAAFSAHPHAVGDTTFNFGQQWGRRAGLRIYALPRRGAARELGHVTMPWNTMMHDFGVTGRHAAFLVCPAKLRLGKALLGSADFLGMFAWDPDSHAELLVVDLDAIDRPIRVELPARWVFHVANAFCRDEHLTIDWVEYPDFSTFAALSANQPDTEVAPPRVRRVTVDLRRRALHGEQTLWDQVCDFPVLPPARVGREYSTSWYSTGGSRLSGGIARLHVGSGAVDRWTLGPGHHVSEPVFVPRPEAKRDDEGWLLAMVHDGEAVESYVAVLDADRPSAGPLAQIWMGQALPVTFHGTFIADA